MPNWFGRVSGGRPGTGGSPPASLHIVIFSKDRACQLDSLLRSIRDNFAVPFVDLTVLYRATTDRYSEGYDLVRKRGILDVAWIREECFHADVLRLAASLPDSDLVMFLVDDDIVFRRFGNTTVLERFTPNHLFISLRCSRSYASVVPPPFITTDHYLEWRWNYGRRKRYAWNYPFSLDGNIFHVSHMKRALPRVAFKAPNSLEGNLHTYRHKWWVKRIPLALAPCEAVVVNNPLNRVQTEGETWHQGVDVASLNEKYLDGYMIDNSPYRDCSPVSVHSPLPLRFIPDE